MKLKTNSFLKLKGKRCHVLFFCENLWEKNVMFDMFNHTGELWEKQWFRWEDISGKDGKKHPKP